MNNNYTSSLKDGSVLTAFQSTVWLSCIAGWILWKLIILGSNSFAFCSTLASNRMKATDLLYCIVCRYCQPINSMTNKYSWTHSKLSSFTN